MKILITGDRLWVDRQTIYDVIYIWQCTGLTHIVQGGARGADTLANDVAKELGIISNTYLADWEKYGKAAGVIRNQEMLDSNPDIQDVLAFHDDIHNSRGTKDMIHRAQKINLPVTLYYHTYTSKIILKGDL